MFRKSVRRFGGGGGGGGVAFTSSGVKRSESYTRTAAGSLLHEEAGNRLTEKL